ncbi:MAG: hypothetical protein AB1768_16100 [Pseudomonadota bacterium]
MNRPFTAIAGYGEASGEELRRPRCDKDLLVDNLRRIAVHTRREGRDKVRVTVEDNDPGLQGEACSCGCWRARGWGGVLRCIKSRSAKGG